MQKYFRIFYIIFLTQFLNTGTISPKDKPETKTKEVNFIDTAHYSSKKEKSKKKSKKKKITNSKSSKRKKLSFSFPFKPESSRKANCYFSNLSLKKRSFPNWIESKLFGKKKKFLTQ
ncbi:Uncharacterized protein LB4E_3117 [Leptospira borgpetersenii str. 4E]|nr:Uncharacterized protein LB4E_3117 [Leptospira borgpetersenii str. 4E]